MAIKRFKDMSAAEKLLFASKLTNPDGTVSEMGHQYAIDVVLEDAEGMTFTMDELVEAYNQVTANMAEDSFDTEDGAVSLDIARMFGEMIFKRVIVNATQ